MKKTAIVTGASGEIGTAISELLITQGYYVIGTYCKNKKFIEELALQLGNNFFPFQCDLSDFDAAKDLLTYIEEKQFQVEVLINNAGISIVGLLQDLTKEYWNNIWNTNVTSAISLSQAVIPVFLKQGGGKIINISSVWGNRGASCEAAYSATKGAVNTFTKALAKELAPSNIQVNVIACGIIDTKMNAHLTDEDINEIVDEIPAGRLGTPADVAKTVCALLTASPYMTGQIITLDGGWTV
ncbi:MAG: SDR family oxidoreductase [Eubacterium sp.]|nr:SDR family oxidoreductase [Eubacterium sp.]